MCLAIPGQIRELLPDDEMAVVDVMGVRRKISMQMLVDEPATEGDWVLIHVGFAMSKISDEDAREQLRVLEAMGDDADAQAEARGYAFGHAEDESGGPAS
ncbi:MAG: HypC/HybG/HupF family hydrogenase formation chaperone [Phycisphaeraceae bacterium]|nr:MAG: HypC/HybG/HupF family hydrogenase formation chaperone [Phycisphaeraceae bacterium]